eukprot:TRINITY_DN21560_c0_g1_i1.p1 TRINITY_DN21560_c0_g1~~TRINITY_DN21560_c0_g1_i1.p1  ORF type:complete len:147 (+),score=8.29 TRINITY_DN21560_c0_g1_i1:601-1041(+)
MGIMRDTSKTILQHGKSMGAHLCVMDGWTSNNRWHIINFMAYCVTLIVFVRSVYTSGHRQDAQYFYMLIEQTIQQIDGWEDVVQVVTDNAMKFKAARKIVHEKKLHIVWVLCVAYCIDLMLEDISKLEDVQNTIEGKMIMDMIHNH